MYGVCRGCAQNVQLMYESPENRGKLVISRHEAPPNCLKPEEFKNLTCSGSGKEPNQQMAAQE